ncbi:MAG: 2-C-methyl-D-erythritol 4-phosphate cytidylyltransferase [candidate division KSB1 bacterium]
MANFAIVVAAGQGTRFGSEMPKQFLLLRDRPILAHTLERFETAEAIAQVVIVAAQAWHGYIKREIVERFQFNKCRAIVAGGERRQDSVWAGLQALKLTSTSLVVVHDAVRPLFSHALLERVLAGCESFDGCIPALALRDTVKQVSGPEVTATIPRESLRLAQTPQAFRSKILQRAFAQTQQEQLVGTDEAALVEKSGGRIGWVEGEETNLKITMPSDLKIAEAFLQELA